MTGNDLPWLALDDLSVGLVSVGRTPEPRREPEAELDARLAAAVDAVGAPDAVFALSRHGRRLVRSGGTAPAPAASRAERRYEIGSATKTFTALLLTRLIDTGAVTGSEPAATLLAPADSAPASPATLAHLITHTAGLPPLPRDFYVNALPAWRTNPYARYPAPRVREAFLRHHPRHRPGTRWRYSNFGVAVLGLALSAATGTTWEELLAAEVLHPLGLADTATRGDHVRDAVGHRKDGVTPTPGFDAGGFQAAGALRCTPNDLLTFLEAHLQPAATPLREALTAVQRPVLRRGLTHRHVHTAGWFRHPTEGGPMYFHSGATLGQQAFLGFRPDTGTALAAVCTRRFGARDPFIPTAYGLLAGQ
ncbi:serine hydrolase domain-containing protein [Streptomyces sp. NPDC020489]|uniref:serine hydrolase domain-containing protein n=1 Tax=Streptomyces sp. NPDC020489 TaxID=3365077 RepID=UPI0037902F6F